MAETSFTPANVVEIANSTQFTSGTAGEAVVAGEMIYLKAGDSKLWLAKDATKAEAAVVGMAMNDAAAEQPVQYATGGTITTGAGTPALVTGTMYVIGTTAGVIQPTGADQVTGDWVSFVGWAISTTALQLILRKTDLQIP